MFRACHECFVHQQLECLILLIDKNSIKDLKIVLLYHNTLCLVRILKYIFCFFKMIFKYFHTQIWRITINVKKKCKSEENSKTIIINQFLQKCPILFYSKQLQSKATRCEILWTKKKIMTFYS